MSNLRIAIIIGSTRPGRNGKAVADWIAPPIEEDGAAVALRRWVLSEDGAA